MITINEIASKIKGMEADTIDDLKKKITGAFEGYDFDGISEIIVTRPNNSKDILNAKANSDSAPVIGIDYFVGEEGILVCKTWIV